MVAVRGGTSSTKNGYVVGCGQVGSSQPLQPPHQPLHLCGSRCGVRGLGCGSGVGVSGLRFWVWDVGLRVATPAAINPFTCAVQALGFWVWCVGLDVQGLGCGAEGLGFGVWLLRFRIWGVGLEVQGLGCGA